ncbi:hypothetical protein BDR07DRAFT_1446765 [Suillus spraguei]|nr:hypothetical protein BDR07DRAFT_1446765 [Suillus spraguei]
MWTVKRSYVEDQHGKHRCGGMVPLTSVMHAVELIPEYGEKIHQQNAFFPTTRKWLVTAWSLLYRTVQIPQRQSDLVM